jgi:hypothetical protein
MQNPSANLPDWFAARAEVVEIHLQADDFVSARAALEECMASLRDHSPTEEQAESIKTWFKASIASAVIGREQLRKRAWSLPRQPYTAPQSPSGSPGLTLIL